MLLEVFWFMVKARLAACSYHFYCILLCYKVMHRKKVSWSDDIMMSTLCTHKAIIHYESLVWIYMLHAISTQVELNAWFYLNFFSSHIFSSVSLPGHSEADGIPQCELGSTQRFFLLKLSLSLNLVFVDHLCLSYIYTYVVICNTKKHPPPHCSNSSFRGYVDFQVIHQNAISEALWTLVKYNRSLCTYHQLRMRLEVNFS